MAPRPILNVRSARSPWAVLACALGLGLALSACATAPVPTTQMAVAEASVQKANSTSTRQYAGVELQRAVDKLAQAQHALVNKDYDGARRFAEQADVDAQVADLHAHAVRALKAAQDSRDASKVLSDEIQRSAPR